MEALLMAAVLICNPITMGVIRGVEWSRDCNTALSYSILTGYVAAAKYALHIVPIRRARN